MKFCGECAAPLASMPWLAPLSWIFQTLAVFFLVGGYFLDGFASAAELLEHGGEEQRKDRHHDQQREHDAASRAHAAAARGADRPSDLEHAGLCSGCGA